MTNWNPEFLIKDASGNDVLKIRGACRINKFWNNYCEQLDPLLHNDPLCYNEDFEVLTLEEEQQIGKVTKQWAGAFTEFITDADNFGITFPMDLDVKVKATLLTACFLIDFLYFERMVPFAW